MELGSSEGVPYVCERYGTAEVRCRRADVEVLNGGGALQACRRGGMEIGSSGGALQVGRGYLDQELWRHTADVQT